MEKFTKIDKDHLERYTCAICLEIFKEPVVINLCMHVFCKDCILYYFEYYRNKYGKNKS